MRFSVAAVAALVGAAFASPVPQNDDPKNIETITIKEFEAINQSINNTGPVTSIKFQILSSRTEGVAAFVCEATNPAGLPSNVFNCKGGSTNDAYRFMFNGRGSNDNVFNLTVFHQTAPAFGSWGAFSVATLCSVMNGAAVCKLDGERTKQLHYFG